MFRTNDPSRLRQQLDRFTIPMFVAELPQDQAEFEILAINKAHEEQSGCSMRHVTNRPLSTVLPPEQAQNSNTNYSKCTQSEGPLRYREQLQMPKGLIIWDTSLSRLEMPDGRLRVIGTALVVQGTKRHDLDTLAFQDIDYFAATSAMRVAQISDVLAAVEDGKVTSQNLVGSAGMLAALCRCITKTLEELRSIANLRLAQEEGTTAVVSMQSFSHKQGTSEVDAALRSLIGMAEDFTRSDVFARYAAPQLLASDDLDHKQRREG